MERNCCRVRNASIMAIGGGCREGESARRKRRENERKSNLCVVVSVTAVVGEEVKEEHTRKRGRGEKTVGIG